MSSEPTDPREKHADEFAPESQEQPGRTDEMRTTPDHGEDTYRGAGRLEGRRALITGGDSGIGRAVAIAFAREGADVAIAHLPEEIEDADDTVRLIADAGRLGVSFAGDIRDERFATSIVADTSASSAGSTSSSSMRPIRRTARASRRSRPKSSTASSRRTSTA